MEFLCSFERHLMSLDKVLYQKLSILQMDLILIDIVVISII